MRQKIWDFDPTGDFKRQFENAVTHLIGMDTKDRTVRIVLIESLIRDYVNQVPYNEERPENERPAPAQLERLVNYILKEELTDKRKNKARIEEYPVFSEFQLTARRSFEVPTSRLVGMNGESTLGEDGKNYRYPTRRKMGTNEMVELEYKDYRQQIIARTKGREDEFIKQANNERQRREREARKPGSVISYNLKDLPHDHELVLKYRK